MLVTQSHLTICDPVNCRPPDSSVHGILQATILEWVAIPFSRGSSRPRDWTQASHIVGRFFIICATREAVSKDDGHIFVWPATLPWQNFWGRLCEKQWVSCSYSGSGPVAHVKWGWNSYCLWSPGNACLLREKHGTSGKKWHRLEVSTWRMAPFSWDAVANEK